MSGHSERIRHVDPSKYKGADVTLAIAERLLDRNSLLVGTDPDEDVRFRTDRLENVTYGGHVEDMPEVYRKTGLALEPSQGTNSRRSLQRYHLVKYDSY